MREYLKLVGWLLLPMLVVLAVRLLSDRETQQASDSPPAAAACRMPTPIPPEVVATLPPNATFISTGLPPARFRANTQVTVQLADPAEVERICGGGLPICGVRVLACHRRGHIVMPNPDLYPPDASLPWSDLFLHEMGHANGWPAWHGD